MVEFIKKDVAEIIGISKPNVAFYTRTLPITPEISVPKRRGSNRKYSFYNLIEFGTVKELAKSKGSPLTVCSKILKQMREAKQNGQAWLTDLINRRSPREHAYAFVYDAFTSDDPEVEFKMVNAKATDMFLTDVDRKPITSVSNITREKNGKETVMIFNLSVIVEKVVKSLPV